MITSDQPETAELIARAVREAEDVSGRIVAGGYRANLSDTESLRNHVRRLASRLSALQAAEAKMRVALKAAAALPLRLELAAKTIEAETTRLSARLVELERALEPFRQWAELHTHVPDSEIVLQWSFGDRGHFEVTMADFRRAASLGRNR
jgi:hypothetical protein